MPWSIRQDSPGAQETCGPGLQARGRENTVPLYHHHLYPSVQPAEIFTVLNMLHHFFFPVEENLINTFLPIRFKVLDVV